MRFLLFISVFFSSIGLSYVFAESSMKTEGGVHSTPHPPHDHHETDHIKKLDESLRKSREEEKEED